MAKLEELKGKTLKSIIVSDNKEEIIIETESNEKYKMYHEQDCCECVRVEDICGDISDLIGHPLLVVDERISQNENPKDIDIPEYQDSFTWTFYEFATIKGSVTIRWYGESNGYYSESVDFSKQKDNGEWERWYD
jgi:hypothetical protein